MQMVNQHWRKFMMLSWWPLPAAHIFQVQWSQSLAVKSIHAYSLNAWQATLLLDRAMTAPQRAQHKASPIRHAPQHDTLLTGLLSSAPTLKLCPNSGPGSDQHPHVDITGPPQQMCSLDKLKAKHPPPPPELLTGAEEQAGNLGLFLLSRKVPRQLSQCHRNHTEGSILEMA